MKKREKIYKSFDAFLKDNFPKSYKENKKKQLSAYDMGRKAITIKMFKDIFKSSINKEN